MSRLRATTRLLLLILCLAPLSGCYLEASFNPVEGPLAGRQPLPAYTGDIDPYSGSVKVSLDNGEIFKSPPSPDPYSAAAASAEAASSSSSPGLPQADLTKEWDLVYGPGYYRAHVLGEPLHKQIPLTGSKGSTAVLELFNEHSSYEMFHQYEHDSFRGVARDSHGNVYKVTLHE